MSPRFYTNKLYELIEDHAISESTVVSMCLQYMSEADVKDMMEANDLVEEEEDEDSSEWEEIVQQNHKTFEEWDEQRWKDARKD